MLTHLEEEEAREHGVDKQGVRYDEHYEADDGVTHYCYNEVL